MRILVDASVMQQFPTGIAKATVGLYVNCLKELPALEVIAFHQKRLMCELPQGFKDLSCCGLLPAELWRDYFIPLLLRKERPWAVHFPWNGNIPSHCGGTKVITTLHDVLPLIIPSYFKNSRDEYKYRKKVQQDIYRTDLLLTDSHFSKNEIMNNFDVKTEPMVLYLGPTLSAGLEPLQDPGTTQISEDYFLYVGGYDSRKGIDKLVKVFLELKQQKRIGSKLILTGKQNFFSDEFRIAIDKGKQLGFIEEKGYVSDSVLVKLYSNAKALVYPSKYEGFGLPPLEAMNLGCPVITTFHTSIPEICGNAAFYIEPDNEKNFAEGLIEVENNVELRNHLIEEGKKRAARFSWASSAKAFLTEVIKIHQ